MNNINIDKIIYKWFEMKYQTYDKLEHGVSIYIYYEGEEYADILIDKKYREIIYKWGLYEEFEIMIPIELNDFEKIMSKWVEDNFNLIGFTSRFADTNFEFLLKIPK